MDRQFTEILLVEDNEDDADLAIRALKKQHLANLLVHLKDGQQALDYIFGNGQVDSMVHQSRVILLDLNLPGINGMEVLQKIKSDVRTNSIPVVVLTSSSDDPCLSRCYDLGANSYIVKPLEFANFLEAVSDLGMYWMVMNQPPGNAPLG